MKTAIRIILLAMALVCLNKNYCWGAEVSFGEGIDIPVFAGSQDLWGGPQPVDINGVPTRMVCFGTNSPVDAVLNFYQTQMPKLGWQLGEIWEGLSVIYFTKGNNYLYVAASGALRGYAPTFTKFTVVLSKKEVHLCATANLVFGPDFKETPGRDLSFMPRYPGSIRAANIVRGEKEAFFIYVSRDDAKKIIDFYRKALPTFGWRVAENFSLQRTCVQRSFHATALIFKRGNKDGLSVYVSYCEESQANIIIISYNYAFNYAVWPLNTDQAW